MNTSLGHHTFTIHRRIVSSNAKKLLDDFHKYRDRTNEIKVYIPNRELKKVHTLKRLRAHGIRVPTGSNEMKIDYISDSHKGLNWILKFYKSSQVTECIIEAKINPKVFAGIRDYIIASNDSYLRVVEELFNEEASRISPLLGKFSLYTPKRIDFCINFDLMELGIPCTPEQMMWLIKRGDYPSYFQEWQYYDKKSHRWRNSNHSFYLKSGTVNINCYYKYLQLKEQFSDCPNIEDALHIIRFEVQCLYRKTYMMMNRMKKQLKKDNITDPIAIIHRMLSDMTAERELDKYFKRMIKSGDYYTLAEATRMIEDEGFPLRKEEDIIYFLNEINKVGLARIRERIHPSEINRFYKVLDELAKLNINPITIPKSFKVKHIPNLLDSFNRLKESGGLIDTSYIDPYEPLGEPFEPSANHEDVENLLDDNPL